MTSEGGRLVGSAEVEIYLVQACPSVSDPYLYTLMNDVPLREHLEAQIRWLDRYFDDKTKAMNVAVDKAAATIDTRLQGMNEFRDTLRDQAGRLATKEEVQNIDERIKRLEIVGAQGQGRATITGVIWAVGSSILVGAIMKYWL